MAIKPQDMANAIRFLSVDAIDRANSGHPGIALGMADVATVLFTEFLKFDPKHPKWSDRDRFVLSAGHGSMLLYSILYLTGYEDISIDDIKNFRQLGAKTAGHPEIGRLAGVEASTGPLAQGLGMSVGMALAEKILSHRFGSDIVDHYTYVLSSDGCLMEGLSHEAISLAGHLKLNKLIVFWDNNYITIDGKTDLSTSTDQIARFKASGWNTIEIDGHNYDQIATAIAKAQKSDRPTMISCKTIIGYGAPTKQGTEKCHGTALGEEETAAMRKKLGWTAEPFVVPEDILSAWRKAGARGAKDYSVWQARFARLDEKVKADFTRQVIKGKLPSDWNKTINKTKAEVLTKREPLATRNSLNFALAKTLPYIPEIIGGSADLSESNGVLVKDYHEDLTANNYGGNFIHYGVREHVMGTCMNGMLLHGGVIPFVATFFAFMDYMLPSIRMACQMNIPGIYIFSHDSIAVGEDGPSHQPVEQLPLLRVMPNLKVFRPADTIETIESWEYILEHRTGPAVMLVTRQNVEQVRTDATENKSAKGGYIISPSKGERVATIVATGSEVSLAIKAQKLLAEKGIDVAVVSIPCKEVFEEQPMAYQQSIIDKKPTIVVEAANLSGWGKYTRGNGDKIGMTSFGTSGPYKELFVHFGFTPEHVAEVVTACVNKDAHVAK